MQKLNAIKQEIMAVEDFLRDCYAGNGKERFNQVMAKLRNEFNVKNNKALEKVNPEKFYLSLVQHMSGVMSA